MKILKGKPFPLGVTIENQIVNFAVDAGEKVKCDLLLYKRNSEEVLKEIAMQPVSMIENIYSVALPETDVKNLVYNYKINDKIVMDPFVIAVEGKKGWLSDDDLEGHEIRGRIKNKPFDWGEDVLPMIPDQDVIAYSLHMRGYTMHPEANVKNKGTFEGLIEKIPYLKELGVNQIQCLPIYEFDEWLKPDSNYLPSSCKEDWKINYWGYGPGKFMAPKSAFSSVEDVGSELKKLVRSLHQNGMEIVLNFPFDGKILPQDMIQILRFWHMEYHIDGFIINPYVISFNMVAGDPALKNCKLYVKNDDFQKDARRFLKGDEGMIGGVKYHFTRIAGNHICNTITSSDGFTLHDLVSYERKHNHDNGERNRDGIEFNYSWNCGAEGPTEKKEVINLRKNQARNAMAMLLLSQGTPCILAGDEFLNSQNGNNNVYCQDNEVGWTDWSKAGDQEEMIKFVKDLIAFRKKHPVLRSNHVLHGNDPKRTGLPDLSFHSEEAWQLPLDAMNRQIGILFGGSYMDDEDIYIVYNMHWNEHEFALPALQKDKNWYLEFSTMDGFLEEPRCLGRDKMANVGERTIEIFVGR